MGNAMIATWIWVLIPLAAIAAGLVRKWLTIKEREIEAATADAERHAVQSQKLEQRVRVLERIITDRGFAVSEEIDRLRDDGSR